MRAAYLGGQSIASLAREHDVSRGAIRTAVADLMPDHASATRTPRPRSRQYEIRVGALGE